MNRKNQKLQMGLESEGEKRVLTYADIVFVKKALFGNMANCV